MVTLCGPGGIGKTALAIEAVHQEGVTSRFPDGLIFHSFYGKPDPALALEHIARSFGEDPQPTPVEAAVRALAGKKALLLLDGTEEANDLQAVLNVRGGCGVLVTSHRNEDAVAEWQDLMPLGSDDAIVLLRKWGGDYAADTEVAEQICELVGRLPLAVRLAGRYLKHQREAAKTYLQWLKETPLEVLNQGRRRKESVPVLLEKSLTQVSNQARQVLSVVGLLALAPFGREPLAAALGTKAQAVRRPLGELVSYSLLWREGEQYTVTHALIHTYARTQVQPEATVVEQLAEYYTTLAKAESEQGLTGYHRLDAERPHIMAILASCAQQEAWAAVQRLVLAVDKYLNIRGYATERVTALEAGIKAARVLQDRRDEGAFLGNLGIAYRDLGQIEQAIKYYQQALAIVREIGNRQGEAACLGNLGMGYHDLKQIKKAIKYYQKGLAIAREIGNRQGEANQLGNLGEAYRDLRQVEQATEHYHLALKIAREIGDRRGEGVWLGNLGMAYRDLRQVEQATEHYHLALEIAREIGDRYFEGTWLSYLGELYKNQGNLPLARQYLEKSLAIYEAIKSPDADRVRNRLAELEDSEDS